MERINRGEVTFVLIIILFVLGITLGIGAAFVVSKEINFSNLLLRGTKWFSSSLSSLNYGLYKLNMVKEVVPGQEVTIPYFGKENLLPFFYWPSTITILGGEIVPISYEGYFGFRDILYPISWIFRWLVIREGGQIKNITIQEVTASQPLQGLYYYYDTNRGCPIIKLFKQVYAALELDYTLEVDYTLICGQGETVFNDSYVNTGKILGDDAATVGIIENYVAELEFNTPKHVDYVSIYLDTISSGGYVTVSYFPIATNQIPIEIASTTITGRFVNLNVDQDTQKIRIAVKPNAENIQATLMEFYAYGH